MSNWEAVFKFLDEKKTIHIIGGLFVATILTVVNTVMGGGFNMAMVCLVMAGTYGFMSDIKTKNDEKNDKSLLLITEAFCYLYGAVILMFIFPLFV